MKRVETLLLSHCMLGTWTILLALDHLNLTSPPVARYEDSDYHFVSVCRYCVPLLPISWRGEPTPFTDSKMSKKVLEHRPGSGNIASVIH